MTPAVLQTADGRGKPHALSVFNPQHRVFVAGADVQRQRLDAYEAEYAEVALKGTQKAICCPAGGQLHLQEGGIIPISPWDWVVELPDGTMGSLSAENVADSMEFVDGPDEARDMFDRTVEYVENARKKPAEGNPPVRVENAEVLPHPDSGRAADIEFDRRAKENLQADLQRQAEEARAQLDAIASVAIKRRLITKEERDEWLDTAIAPDGVNVRYDGAINSYEVTRTVPEPSPDPGGSTSTSEGDAGDAPTPDPEGDPSKTS